eukprot:1159389-Pelagomonas_calceolata.AAC.4
MDPALRPGHARCLKARPLSLEFGVCKQTAPTPTERDVQVGTEAAVVRWNDAVPDWPANASQPFPLICVHNLRLSVHAIHLPVVILFPFFSSGKRLYQPPNYLAEGLQAVLAQATCPAGGQLKASMQGEGWLAHGWRHRIHTKAGHIQQPIHVLARS